MSRVNKQDLFLDEEFPDYDVKKTYRGVRSIDEFWQFVDGPLIGGLFNEGMKNFFFQKQNANF